MDGSWSPWVPADSMKTGELSLTIPLRFLRTENSRSGPHILQRSSVEGPKGPTLSVGIQRNHEVFLQEASATVPRNDPMSSSRKPTLPSYTTSARSHTRVCNARPLGVCRGTLTGQAVAPGEVLPASPGAGQLCLCKRSRTFAQILRPRPSSLVPPVEWLFEVPLRYT